MVLGPFGGDIRGIHKDFRIALKRLEHSDPLKSILEKLDPSKARGSLYVVGYRSPSAKKSSQRTGHRLAGRRGRATDSPN